MAPKDTVLLKTVLHIIVALTLWFGLGWLDIGVGWRLGAIVAGGICVHLFWEHFVFNPYLYLGAMPVSNDDPVMVQAREKAAGTLPLFLEKIFPEHRQDSMVKFRFTTSSGEVEKLWADLLEVNGNTLKVYVRTYPVHHDQLFNDTQEVDIADIVDWQVEYRDGTLRGGYTNRALFTIFERQEGYLPSKLKPQLARYREIDEPDES